MGSDCLGTQNREKIKCVCVCVCVLKDVVTISGFRKASAVFFPLCSTPVEIGDHVSENGPLFESGSELYKFLDANPVA